MPSVQEGTPPSTTACSPVGLPMHSALSDEKTTMVKLTCDGSFALPEATTLLEQSPTRCLVEIPANLALQQNTLIDRVLDYMFATPGLRTIEVRVYEERPTAIKVRQ